MSFKSLSFFCSPSSVFRVCASLFHSRVLFCLLTSKCDWDSSFHSFFLFLIHFGMSSCWLLPNGKYWEHSSRDDRGTDKKKRERASERARNVMWRVRFWLVHEFGGTPIEENIYQNTHVCGIWLSGWAEPSFWLISKIHPEIFWPRCKQRVKPQQKWACMMSVEITVQVWCWLWLSSNGSSCTLSLPLPCLCVCAQTELYVLVICFKSKNYWLVFLLLSNALRFCGLS